MRHTKRTVEECSAGVYRWLLRAYPATFREQYGHEMSLVFRDALRDAWRERGWTGLVALWIRTLPDLLASATRERVRTAGSLRLKDVLLWEFPEWVVAPVQHVGVLLFSLVGWVLLFVLWTGEQMDAGRPDTLVWPAFVVALTVGWGYRFGAARLSPQARRLSARGLLLACAILITAKGVTEAYTLLCAAGLCRTIRDSEANPLFATMFVEALYVLFLVIIGGGHVFGLVTLDQVQSLAVKPGPFVYGWIFLALLGLGWTPALRNAGRRWWPSGTDTSQ